jgi:hypothetical protein
VRRALIGAVSAAALLAAPAAAQTPIAGSGSFNDAPELAPGRYADTLRGDETLFYGVRLKPGQRLTAGATVKGRAGGSYFIKLTIYSPLRAADINAGEQTESFGQTDRSVSLRVEGKPVGVGDQANQDPADVYSQPGVFYVSLAADTLGSQGGTDQFDTVIDLQVTGEPVPEATPTATAKPAQTAEPGGVGGGSDDGSGGSGELGMAIVLGLALGGLVGFGVRRLRAA